MATDGESRSAIRIGAWGLLGVVVASAWTVSASWLFVQIGELSAYYPMPLTTWWLYATSPKTGVWTGPYLAVSALLAAMPWMLIGALMHKIAGRKKKLRRSLTGGRMKPLERGTSDNHGHASWASKKQLAQRFGKQKGCLIGALDRSSTPLKLFDDLSEGPFHSLLFSGPGGFKTTTAITRLWHWNGARVVFDPSCEIGPIMTEALESTGHTVKTVSLNASGVDVLDWINVTDTEADVHIKSAVEWIYDEGAAKRGGAPASDNPFWPTWGKSLVACLMAHMLFDKQMQFPKTLESLRLGLSTPETEMQNMLKNIAGNSESGMARDIARGLMGMRAVDTFSGIYSSAFAATAWLSVETYGRLVSGSAVRTADILNDKAVVFIQTPLRSLIATPAVGKAVMGAFFNALYHADGQGIDNPILFEIDEAWVLGALSEIRLGYTTARKYRGVIQTMWQSEGQMEGVWGADDAKMLRDSASWRAYGAVQDGAVAEKLSRDIGEHAVMAFSEGLNDSRQFAQKGLFGSRSRGSNTNLHEIKRRLILPAEIMRASADDLFVLARDFPFPIKCVAAPYFRYPDIAGQMNRSRFAPRLVG